MITLQERSHDAISLLKKLIRTPSFSKEEGPTADIIEAWLKDRGMEVHRQLHNVFAKNSHFNPSLPTLLLNSHHDTVKPSRDYTLDPFDPMEKEGRLYGLGSNDAGGCLVSLIAAFAHFYERKNLRYNLVMAATAEEEISGSNGVEYLLNNEVFLASLQGSAITGAIVGEPTKMEMAVSEMGLLVVDAVAIGRSGHAARNEGENALYKAIKDIHWLQQQPLEKVSQTLPLSKTTVTVIQTDNKAHNVVPDKCSFVIDVRVNDRYSFEDVLQIMQENMHSELHARSIRLRSTSIPLDHPLVVAGISLGRTYYGSPTTSDKALMPFPALKMGPGDSARSHTPDEYIYLSEIKNGMEMYIQLLEKAMES